MSGPSVRQIVVRLVNTDGHLRDYHLPTEELAVTEIVLKNGTITLRPQNWLLESENVNDIIAALYSSPGQLIFEARVEGCSVHPPSDYSGATDPSGDWEKVTIPRSIDEEGHLETFCTCLRPDDTVNFNHHNFGLLVLQNMAPRQSSVAKQLAAPVAPAMATSDPDHLDEEGGNDDGEMIKVKSPAKATTNGDDEDGVATGSETEAEDQGDPDATPEEAPPTGPTTLGTSAESLASRSKSSDGKLPSTVDPDHTETDNAVGIASSAPNVNSPLTRKSKESQGDTQTHANRLYEGAKHSSELGDDLIFASSQPTPKRTYGRKTGSRKGTPASSRATPRKSTKLATVTNNDGVDAEENIDVAGQPVTADGDEAIAGENDALADKDEKMVDGDEDDVMANGNDGVTLNDDAGPEPEVPTTSDARDTPKSAKEAARRTMQGAKKRKASETTAAGEEDHTEEPIVPQKRRKTLPKAAQPEEDADAVPGKLKRPTRSAARNSSPVKPQKSNKRTDSSSTLENIVVVPRATAKSKQSKAASTTPSSPKVVVRSNVPRATPASSAGSTSTALNGKLVSVLLSHSAVKDDAKAKQWLRSQGLTIREEIQTSKANFLCVVPGGKLGTTAKVLRSLALGKAVVTEDWVSDSMREGQLLDPPDYVHEDLVETMDVDRSTLFWGKTLFFTDTVAKAYGGSGWESIYALGNEAGASRVAKGTAANVLEIEDDSDLFIIGSEKGDVDAHHLMKVEGKTVYHKDLLTQSVLRGEVDLESDEFKMSISTAGGKRKKR